jgi:hypothetical protein
MAPRLPYCAAREARLGEVRAARADLQKRYDAATASADQLAALALWLGERDRTVDLLKEACDQRGPTLSFVNVEPLVAAIRDDPRCREVLRERGLLSP